MTLDCADVVMGYDAQLTDMVDVTCRFGWFTHTVALPYQAEGIVVTYACPCMH
jgi:hypothetical protein